MYKYCKNIIELNFNYCHWLTGSQFRPYTNNNREHIEIIKFMFCERLDHFEDILTLTKCRDLDDIEFHDRNCTEHGMYEFQDLFF